MNAQKPSLYLNLASSIRVEEIMKPISGYINPDEPIESVYEDLMMERGASDADYFIVNYKNNTFGLINLIDTESFDTPLTGIAGDKAGRIFPEQIISESYAVFQIYDLLIKYWIIFVKNENQITHYVARSDINALPSRLCVYILILELEAEITRLLKEVNFYKFNEKFLELPSRRLESINFLYLESLKEKRSLSRIYGGSSDDVVYQGNIFDQDDYRVYIPWLSFSDKNKIIGSFTEVTNHLPFQNRLELNHFFRQINKLRNLFAHGNPIWEDPFQPDLKEILVTISRLKEVTDALKGISKK